MRDLPYLKTPEDWLKPLILRDPSYLPVEEIDGCRMRLGFLIWFG